ncbi:hypothetical protein L1987_65406 [Smallanthus sonchifolius]|uniref:Uncharacterized protein n=1 Tax=Smallanthus sonchifolius TaxID=185202 RepID=A0ACB9BUC4_9ASTR|nr:hypothetical protein L1987_65406 [Smallanthus sonchifolius]
MSAKSFHGSSVYHFIVKDLSGPFCHQYLHIALRCVDFDNGFELLIGKLPFLDVEVLGIKDSTTKLSESIMPTSFYFCKLLDQHKTHRYELRLSANTS